MALSAVVKFFIFRTSLHDSVRCVNQILVSTCIGDKGFLMRLNDLFVGENLLKLKGQFLLSCDLKI